MTLTLIFKEINSEYSLERLMLKLKLQYFDHSIQRVKSLEKTLMLEKTEGRRRRRQQRMRWLNGIINLMARKHPSHTYACVLSCFRGVRLFATPWTIAHQAPLSMGFSRQEYWSGLPCPPPGDLPNPGIKPVSLTCTCTGRWVLYH